MQLSGGLYILYPGYVSFIEVGSGDEPSERLKKDDGHFRTGFLVCISNPKSIIFFVALFPGFISQELNVVLQSVVYGTVLVLLDAVFIMGYSFLVIRAFASPAANKLSVSKVSGVGLMIVGALLCWNGLALIRSA